MFLAKNSTKLLKSIATLVLICTMYVTFVFIGLQDTKAQNIVSEGNGVQVRGCGSWINNMDELDAYCRCPRTYCRLSVLGEAEYGGQDGQGQGTGRVLISHENYLCVAGTRNVNANTRRVEDIPGSARYNGAAALDQVGFGSRATQEEERAINEGLGQAVRGLAANFYVDEFNKMPNNQNIPKGAVCKITGENNTRTKRNTEQAYWYYPDYFNPARNSGAAVQMTECTPILVSEDLFGDRNVVGVKTFFGCLPASQNGIIAFMVRLIVGVSGLITFIIILLNLLKIMANATNPDAIAESRKKLISATVTFIVLILSLSILNIVGLQILDLESYGGGVLRLFTGG